MTEHSRVAPSSMARIVQCPGSVTLSAPYLPEPDTEESIEGTRAHAVAMAMLGGEALPDDVDPDMREGAELWCEALDHVPGNRETFLTMPNIHNEAFGTCDYFRIDDDGVVTVADYKYGHRFTDARWQLYAYAAGIVARERINDECTGFRFIVVQPRWYGGERVRTSFITYSELLPYWNVMQRVAHEALGDNPRTATGAECEFCPARHGCLTLQERTAAIAEYLGQPEDTKGGTASMAQELRMLEAMGERLKARASGLRAKLEALAKQGERIPWYRMEATVGREEWTDPATAAALAKIEGIDLVKPNQLITPNQARKLGFDADLVKQFSQRKPGSLKLIPDDNSQSRRIFSGK